MVERSFRDERCLPFEFSDAVGRCRIELRLPENDQFDLDTVAVDLRHRGCRGATGPAIS